MNVKQLRESTQAGYNLAALMPGNHAIKKDVEFDLSVPDWIPVLKECEGPEGVLRGLDLPGKMPGIQKSLLEDGGEYTLLHMIFHEHGTELRYTCFKLWPL